MAYANSPDKEEAVWSGSTLFAILQSTLKNNCIKTKFRLKKVWNKVFEILGYLPYVFMEK